MDRDRRYLPRGLAPLHASRITRGGPRPDVNPFLDRSTLPESFWKWVLLPSGLVGIVATWYVGPNHRHIHETIICTLQGLFLVPVFVGAVRFPGWAAFRPLGWRWVRTAGLLSYVLYLVHDTIIIAVQQLIPAPWLVQAVVAICLALAFAVLVRRFIELPCARLRRRLAHVVLGSGSAPAPPERVATLRPV